MNEQKRAGQFSQFCVASLVNAQLPCCLLPHATRRNVESSVTGYFSKPVAVALVTLLWKAVRKTGHRTEGGPSEPIEMLIQLLQEVYALVGSPAINVDSVYHVRAVEALLRSGKRNAPRGLLPWAFHPHDPCSRGASAFDDV